MANWMLYAVVAAAALSAAGLLAERGLVLLRRPSRWLWLLVMTASGSWPFVSSAVLSSGAASLGGEVGPAVGETRSGMTTAWSVSRFDLFVGVPDGPLLVAWCLASSLVLVLLRLSAETLKQDRRQWRSGTVAGQPVFLSGWLGPAVIGTFAPQIVLPRWVLEMDEGIQRLIVLHEREHVRAGDSRLLMTGLLLLVLLPWCLPLFWQFQRLRMAIETDCDRRLLRTGAPAREYAHALLTVAERRRRMMVPLAAMTPSKAALKRRLRLIAAGPPRGPVRLALALLAVAALLSLGAASIPLPRPPSLAGLASPFRSYATGAPASKYGPPLMDGSLPGDPGEERLAAEIRTHHAAAIASGLPAGSVIWFIEDRNGTIARTGIERGTEREVTALLRTRYPTETSEFSFAWSGVHAAPAAAGVVWLRPGP